MIIYMWAEAWGASIFCCKLLEMKLMMHSYLIVSYCDAGVVRLNKGAASLYCEQILWDSCRIFHTKILKIL